MAVEPQGKVVVTSTTVSCQLHTHLFFLVSLSLLLCASNPEPCSYSGPSRNSPRSLVIWVHCIEGSPKSLKRRFSTPHPIYPTCVSLSRHNLDPRAARLNMDIVAPCSAHCSALHGGSGCVWRREHMLASLVRFEGDQVLGIRLRIVIGDKDLGVAHAVNC